MVKLAIRDDDMNFFTKVEDVENVYKDISFFPVSFAIIPKVMDVSTCGKCPDTKGNTTPRWVGDNTELISWLKEKLECGKADALMHGITHHYEQIKGVWQGEMLWYKDPELSKEIATLKERLSKELNYPISVFVAPSNEISKYAINCVAASGMDFSGIIPIGFQRDITIKNLKNYVKRWYYRAKDRLPYPGILEYTTHKEINACNALGYDYLVRMFNYCEKMEMPMAVNVHYWQLRGSKQSLSDLVRFVEYAMEQKAIPSTVSSLLK